LKQNIPSTEASNAGLLPQNNATKSHKQESERDRSGINLLLKQGQNRCDECGAGDGADITRGFRIQCCLRHAYILRSKRNAIHAKAQRKL
jgi:hypothetical protein